MDGKKFLLSSNKTTEMNIKKKKIIFLKKKNKKNRKKKKSFSFHYRHKRKVSCLIRYIFKSVFFFAWLVGWYGKHTQTHTHKKINIIIQFSLNFIIKIIPVPQKMFST